MVRDQAAMIIAGVVTFIIFGAWALTLPDKFSGMSDQQTGSIISSFKEDISTDAPDFADIKDLPKEIESLSEVATEEEASVVIPNEFPATSTQNQDRRGPAIRLATTSSDNATNTQNSQ